MIFNVHFKHIYIHRCGDEHMIEFPAVSLHTRNLKAEQDYDFDYCFSFGKVQTLLLKDNRISKEGALTLNEI